MRLLTYILTIIFILTISQDNFAQFPGHQHIFGKNRVQYKQFDWQQVSSQNFDIFYYGKNLELGKITAQTAENDFSYITNLIGYAPFERMRIFVYQNNADLLQSNIGINQQNFKAGGQTNFAKNVIEVAYSGDLVSFSQQMRFEITDALLLDMIYGGNIKDILQNTYLLSLPNWVIEGASSYTAYGWNEEMDNFIREKLIAGKLKQPHEYEGIESALVGQSVWNFIVQEYGENTMSNILNLIRITRNEKQSIYNAMGISYDSFVMAWFQYYQKQNASAGQFTRFPENNVILNSNLHIANFDFDNKNNRLLFLENELGAFHLKSKALDANKKAKAKKIDKVGYKVINQLYRKNLPTMLIDEKSYALFFEDKGEMALKIGSFNKKEEKIYRLKDFGTIHSAAISNDLTKIVFSAEKNAQSDIFTIQLSSGSISQLTNDKDDDLMPSFWGDNTVIFASNRNITPIETPNKSNFNIVSLDLTKKTDNLKQMTNIDALCKYPFALNEDIFIYLSDQSGISQLYRYDKKTESSSQITNSVAGIENYRIKNGNLLLQIKQKNNDVLYYFNNFDFKQDRFTQKTARKLAEDLKRLKQKKLEKNNKSQTNDLKEKSTEKDEENPTDSIENAEIDTENYSFNAFNKKKRKRLLKNVEQFRNPTPKEVKFEKGIPYESLFGFEQTTFSFALDPLRNFGLLFELQLSDDSENHKVDIGIFNPNFFFLQNAVLYAEYKYLKNRIDFGARIDRQSYSIAKQSFTQKYFYNRLEASATLPINVSTRFTVAPFYANTHFVVSSEYNPIVQQIAPVVAHYTGFKAEMVVDNAVITGPNLKDGTQLRIRYDQFLSINKNATTFGQLEIDGRYYKKINAALTFASRLAYGRYFANDNKGFRLGGVDNWIFRRDTERNTDPFYVNEDIGEAFRTNRSDILFVRYATPMRGFDYNKLFGSNYLLLNAELRMPLLGLFQTTSSRSRFFNNLQAVVFTDIGAAWTGISPFNRQNSLNTVDINVRPFKATVSNFKDPFLVGYGGGLRSKILNYFTKFDFAWGLEDGKISEVRYYISLGYDF